MSDHRPPETEEIEHDPIDTAYRDAEIILNDDAERSRRRADVLRAVTPKSEIPPVSTSPSRPSVRRPRRWARTAWIPAGCAAGLSLFLAIKIEPLVRRQIGPEPTTPPAPVSETLSFQSPTASPPPAPPSARPAAPLAASSSPGPRRRLAHADRPTPQTSVEPVAPHMTPPPPLDVPVPPAPLPPVRAPVPEAIAPPAPAPPAPAPTTSARTVVTPEALPASEAPTEPSAPSDLGAALRRAAQAGRVADVEALLSRGAAVDAADRNGETALMESIRADHLNIAVILHNHGASLDRIDRSGQSAREMASGSAPKLRQALGLEP